MPDPSPRSVRTTVGIALLATTVAWLWIGLLPERSSFYSIDLYFLFYPAHHRFGQELAQGRLPIWNPDLGLGINELADSQFAFLYPPNLLFAALPTAWAIDVLAWLHAAMACAATFALCARHGLTTSSAAVAAVALACGVALHALAGWTTILATFAWCPVAFLAMRRLADAPGLRAALALAAVLALQLLAGYLQFSLYTIALLPLFAWPRAPATGGALSRTLAWTALAAAIGLGIAAVGVLPALAAVAGSVRERANVPAWFYELVPVRLASYPTGLAAPALDERIPVFAGTLVPLLALCALAAREHGTRLRLPALALTVVAFVLSLGKQTPVYPLLFELPIGHLLTHPHKWTYFFALGLALLAAVGADAVRHAPGAIQRFLWLALGLALLGAVPFSLAARVGGALFVLGLAFLPARLRSRVTPALPFLVVLTILPAYQVRAQRPSDNLNYFARYEDAYRYLAGRQDAGRTFVLLPELTGSPRQGEIAGVAQVTTNGTFLSERLDRYMRATREAAAKGERGRAIGLLRAVGARFVLAGRARADWLGDAGLERVFVGSAGEVWEDLAALPRAYLARRIEVAPADRALEVAADPAIAAGRVAVLEEEDGALTAPPATASAAVAGDARIITSTASEVRIEVDAAAATVLVVLDAWSPEWPATVDGLAVPVRRANVVGRALEVPAGHHEVVFRFVPSSLYAGAAVSLATGLACVIALALARRRRAGEAGASTLGRVTATPRARTAPTRR